MKFFCSCIYKCKYKCEKLSYKLNSTDIKQVFLNTATCGEARASVGRGPQGGEEYEPSISTQETFTAMMKPSLRTNFENLWHHNFLGFTGFTSNF